MVAPVRQVFAPKIISDVVLWEEDLAYSRDAAGVVLATTVTDIGTPLALDANGKLVPLPADGSLTCLGVSLSVRAATSADTTGGVIYIRRTAILKSGGILWPTGITPTFQTQALTDIEHRGVIVRASV